MASETYISPADSAREIAEELIPKYHKRLRRARILYLTTTQAMRRGDQVKLAKSSKLTALQRYLSSGEDGSVESGYDFLILFNDDEWRGLDPNQRRALVDHELQRCYLRERETKRGELKQSWAVRSPEVEEFTAILKRHGLWRPELRQFVRSARQLRLEEADGADPDDADEPEDGDEAEAPAEPEPAGVGA